MVERFMPRAFRNADCLVSETRSWHPSATLRREQGAYLGKPVTTKAMTIIAARAQPEPNPVRALGGLVHLALALI